MPDDEDQKRAFEDAMKGVRPLQQARKVVVPTGVVVTPGHLHRRESAARLPGEDPNPLSLDPPQTYGPHDPVEFRRDGVQHGVFRKLRQGAYDIESRLDLHRLYVADAREAVFRFIQDCQEQELRTVLVLHGKGERSPTPARLKNCVVYWLKQLEAVQAFCSAQPQHGGTGALYLLLRKGERSRLRNAAQYRR